MIPEVKLDDLYQEVVLDHNRRPRNFGKLADANATSHGHNPVCGDDYYLYLTIGRDGKIGKASFEGSGCAISKSSASILTESVQGKTVAEAEELEKNFIKLLTDEKNACEVRDKIGKLKIFEGVRNFPVRVKCAALIWRTMEDALKNSPSLRGTK